MKILWEIKRYTLFKVILFSAVLAYWIAVEANYHSLLNLNRNIATLLVNYRIDMIQTRQLPLAYGSVKESRLKHSVSNISINDNRAAEASYNSHHMPALFFLQHRYYHL